MSIEQFSVLAINLDQSPSRWRHLGDQFSDLNLPVKRITAIAGSELSSEEIAHTVHHTKNRRRYHRPLTLGEIGCYLSHRKAWAALLESCDNYALIVEDDILIHSSIARILASASTLKSWDLIKLSDNRKVVPAKTICLDDDFNLVTYYRVPSCCNGYILSRSGAQKLLSRNEIYRPVDVDIQFHSELNLKVLGITPYPISEARFESDIKVQSGGRHSARSYIWRNIPFRFSLFLERKKISAEIGSVLPQRYLP
ncbi:MAG: glycosyltransferase family 25 protein [Agarilytica sp.]